MMAPRNKKIGGKTMRFRETRQCGPPRTRLAEREQRPAAQMSMDSTEDDPDFSVMKTYHVSDDMEEEEEQGGDEKQEVENAGKRINAEFRRFKFTDLHVLATLRTGNFGQVQLVQIGSDESRSLALKRMKIT